jgi:hypothetical protein
MKTSFLSIRLSLLTAGLALALAGVARGGSYSANFDDGLLLAGTAVYGNAFVDTSAGTGGSGALKLTTATTSQLDCRA